MPRTSLSVFASLAFVVKVVSQASAWGQCGGIGWTGPTTCVSGWVCTYSNPYHSQCLQYSSTTVTPTSSPTPTITYTPLPTLSPTPGWGYVDGDNTIGYYLQSQVLNTASRAVFSAPANASQVQLSGGQLVQNALGMTLYATPETRANSTVTKLAVWWSTEPATGLTFSLEYDYVTMGIQMSGIANPGFLLCPALEGDYYDFYINLQNNITPDGCTNETVFIYYGSIAV